LRGEFEIVLVSRFQTVQEWQDAGSKTSRLQVDQVDKIGYKNLIRFAINPIEYLSPARELARGWRCGLAPGPV
jgi:hypothetical protein